MTCPYKRCQAQLDCNGACHGLMPNGLPMTLEYQISLMQERVDAKLQDFTEARMKNDPLLFSHEQELADLQTQLNVLLMRRHV